MLADGNVDRASHMYTVPDLRPAMRYQFRVAAVNEVGEGPFSNPSNVIDLPQQRKSLRQIACRLNVFLQMPPLTCH